MGIVQRGSKVDSLSGSCWFSHGVPGLMFKQKPALVPSSASIKGYFRVLPPVLFIVPHSPTTGKPSFQGVWEGATAKAHLSPHANAVQVSGYHHWHADHAEDCAALILRF